MPAAGEISLTGAHPSSELEAGTQLLTVHEKAAELLERITDGFLLLDRDWRIVYANSEAERLNGMRREDMLGRNHWELFPGALGTTVHREFLRAAAQAVDVDFENYYAPWQRWFHIKAYPAKEGGLSVFYEDITERKLAEEALRRSEEGFRAIFDSNPECVKVVDSGGRLLQMNPSGLAMIGAESAEEVIGQSVYDLIAPEFRAAFRDLNAEVCSGKRGRLEYDITGLKGDRRHMETHAVPLRRPDDSVVHLAITRDVTDRQRRERAVLLLAAIVDSSDDAIISKDLNGVITSWNTSAQRLFGYTAEEAVGRTVAELLIPADRQYEEPDILAKLRRGERVDHFETVRRRKDGSLLDISLTISPVKDRNGRIIGASKIARDITSRKRTEAELLASEARFRQLADAMPQIVWTAGPDGALDYYNERWYEFTGFERAQFGDSSWQRLVHPDDLPRTREAWNRSVNTGEPFATELRFWDHKAKCWRWFIGRALAVRDANGNIVKWFGTSTDIDEQKRVQNELRRANEDLEQFAYSASHDLQEPLRTLRIYTDLLTQRHSSQLDAQALEFLRFLKDSATRMDVLVRDVLSYTQITRLELGHHLTDANQALAETLANLKGAIDESGARITSDELPSVHVHPTHLRQLLQNIIGNALKYRSAERTPTVHVHAERENGHWRFSVQDNGIGIEPEYKERIFGLFKRLHAGDQYSGSGIGLAICQRIVERYRGRIWVESEPGRGSTFFFNLPV